MSLKTLNLRNQTIINPCAYEICKRNLRKCENSTILAKKNAENPSHNPEYPENQQYLALKGLTTTQDLTIYQKISNSNLKFGGKGQTLRKSHKSSRKIKRIVPNILSRARGAGSPSIHQTSKPRRDTVREPFSPHKGGLNYRNKNGISTGAILTKAG